MLTVQSCHVLNSCPSVQEEEHKKQSGTWLFVSHAATAAEEVISTCVDRVAQYDIVMFKFEPFVLHVCCSNIEHAKAMVWSLQ